MIYIFTYHVYMFMNIISCLHDMILDIPCLVYNGPPYMIPLSCVNMNGPGEFFFCVFTTNVVSLQRSVWGLGRDATFRTVTLCYVTKILFLYFAL